MPTLLNSIISKILNNNNDWRYQLIKNWSSIIGNLSKYVSLEKIESETVIIGVYEPHWMQELYILSNVIINSINNSLGQEKIKQIKFKLIDKENKPKALTLVKINKSNDIIKEINLTNKQKLALNAIKDDQLRSELTRYLIRCSSN